MTTKTEVPAFINARNEEFRLMTGEQLSVELTGKNKKRSDEAQFEMSRRAANKARKKLIKQ